MTSGGTVSVDMERVPKTDHDGLVAHVRCRECDERTLDGFIFMSRGVFCAVREMIAAIMQNYL